MQGPVWWTVFGAGIIFALRQVVATLICEPIRRMAADLSVLKAFSRLWPLKDPTFSGNWEITWVVQSAQFPEENISTVQLHRHFHRVGAQARSPTLSGEMLEYGFVGQISGRVITGTWFDRTDRINGYRGAFQLTTGPTRSRADGTWIGFAQDETVKHGRLLWRRAQDA